MSTYLEAVPVRMQKRLLEEHERCAQYLHAMSRKPLVGGAVGGTALETALQPPEQEAGCFPHYPIRCQFP